MQVAYFTFDQEPVKIYARKKQNRKNHAQVQTRYSINPVPHSNLFHRSLASVALLCAALSAHAMSVLPPSFDELVGEAETVVRGEVTSVRAAYVDTPAGRAIKTFVTFHVERTLKGPAEKADTLTLVFLGGTVGGDTLRVPGMPSFHLGDHEIVFVRGNGSTLCPLIAAGHGRYRVLHDAASNRDYIARENHTPLESTAEVGLPLEAPAAAAQMKSPARALTPADFEARVIETAARLAPPAATQN